jgi:hypothetical protein
MFFGCNKNKPFLDLQNQKGNLRFVKNQTGNFEFGDCFVHKDAKEKNYLLIITSANHDNFISIMPVKVENLKIIDEGDLNNVLITYYSRKPGFIDYLLGGDIPYGSFDLSFERNDKEVLDLLKVEIKYLFSLNLDSKKIKNYGGTSLMADTPLGESLERGLNFGNRFNDENQISIQLPINNLCEN